MASFVSEDGKEGVSGDAFMMQLLLDTGGLSDINDPLPSFTNKIKNHTNVRKMNVPSGRMNCFKLDNINMYDLLTHIQETLSLSNRCIIEMITNEDHQCIKTTDELRKRIQCFAKEYITDEFRELHPRSKVRYKTDDGEFDYRTETDAEWFDRLCHLFMHEKYPDKLRTYKCDECIRRWMISDKW